MQESNIGNRKYRYSQQRNAQGSEYNANIPMQGYNYNSLEQQQNQQSYYQSQGQQQIDNNQYLNYQAKEILNQQNSNNRQLYPDTLTLQHSAFQPFQQPTYNFSNKFQPNSSGIGGGVHKSQQQQQMQQMKKPDPFQFKSADQIVNEFKANSLPKLRLKGLIKLQAVMKGHYTRKYIIPRKKIDQRIFENYVDRLMKHYIEDKMIPDLVLEILTYNKYNEDVSLYSTEYKAHLEIMDKIIMKVVKDIANFTVRDATGNLVGQILDSNSQKKSAAEKDPFALVLQDIMINSIKKDCEEIAQESVKTTTQDYLSDIHLRQLIKDRFINKQVKEVVIDSIEEIIIEAMVEDMSDKLTKELSQPLASRMHEQVQQEVEAVELDKALDSYIQRGMLDIILEQIGVQVDEKNRQKKDLEKQKLQNQKFLDQQF